MTLVKLGHLAQPYGLLPNATRAGVRLSPPAGRILISQNKQAHVWDADVIATGLTHLDENPGPASVLPAAQRAVTANRDMAIDYCNQHGGFENLNPAQIDELAAIVCNSRRREDGTDQGCGFISSQLHEGGICDHVSARSLRFSRAIGLLQDARGFYWTDEYDGCVRYVALATGNGNAAQASDLTSDATVLNYLRTKASPFGDPCFMPHQAGPESVRGGAIYKTPLVQIYTGGNEHASYVPAFAAFGIAICRAGLRALAAEKDGNGNDYHTSGQKALINARRICIFTWNALTSQGGAAVNEPVKWTMPGGYYQSNAFAANAFPVMLAMNVVVLLEERAGIIYAWDDTSKYGTDTQYVSEPHNESGVDVGYFGTSNLTVAPAADRYQPDNVPVCYQPQAKGIADLMFTAASWVNTMQRWVGLGRAFSYLSVKATGHRDPGANQNLPSLDDADFCSTYTDRDYVFQRYRANKSWGYMAYDSANRNYAVAYLNLNLAPHLKETISVMIDGQAVVLGEVWGGQCHTFIDRLAVVV